MKKEKVTNLSQLVEKTLKMLAFNKYLWYLIIETSNNLNLIII